jgi:hypothetical protein
VLDVTLSKETLLLGLDGGTATYTLTATVLPAEAPQTVTWNGSGNVVVVDGVVTVTGPADEVYINASGIGSVMSNPCIVTAFNVEPLSDVTLDTVDDEETLTVTFDPATFLGSVTWATSVSGTVSVVPTSGLVKAVAVGSATITATYNGATTDNGVNPSATCTVTVTYDKPVSLVLGAVPTELEEDDIGSFADLLSTIGPSTANQGLLALGVTWSSDDDNMIEITDEDTGAYEVKGSVGDSATITVTLNGYPDVKATFIVSIVSSRPAP